jgi:transcriptional regulator with XRE-family HTH domain
MKTLKLTKLKSLRESKGWTQETFAELSNLSTRTIQRIESGGSASPESATAIAIALSLQDYTPLIATTDSPALIVPSEKNFLDSTSNSQLSNGGMIALSVTALSFMFMNSMKPAVSSELWVSTLPPLLLLTNLIVFLVVMIKMLKGVGIWVDILNVFMAILNRQPIPYNHDDRLSFCDIWKLMGVLTLFTISLFMALPTITF